MVAFLLVGVVHMARPGLVRRTPGRRFSSKRDSRVYSDDRLRSDIECFCLKAYRAKPSKTIAQADTDSCVTTDASTHSSDRRRITDAA